jgi:folate-binding protein YgfZ
MIETALHARFASRGATQAEDRGVLLPRHFGDPELEYRALRDAAVVVDLGFRTIVRATGADRVGFLQGMLTNDVATIASGENRPALLLTIQGRVTADVRVAAVDDALLLDVDVRARDAMTAALEKLIIADDIELATSEEAVIGVEGPAAAALLAGATLDARVLRGGELGADGFVLHVDSASAGRVWDVLVAAGARPCGMDALEGRRVELGIPRIGLDMDESTLALEVPVESAVSQTKGCYLGQEVVARGTARGHVNRKLVAMRLEGPRPPLGSLLVRDGKEVGKLTTVARAFGAGADAALGFVRKEWWGTGTELAVRHGHAVTVARVTPVPLA